MAAGDHEDCPACGANTAGEQWCGICGLDLHGGDAGNLRELASQLAAIEIELSAISARRNALAAEFTRRRWASDRRAPTAQTSDRAFRPFDRPEPTGSSGEWSVERVRNVLLWSGASLLVLSALAFTAVAWTHLGPGGRAALLVAFTVMSGLAATSLRVRLPATAGAFTGLTIALALVDWQIVRRAGVAPGLSGAAWWATGTAVVAALSAGLARVAAPVPAYRAIALLLSVSAVLTVAANADASWSRALGLALVAAGLVVVDRHFTARLVDPVARATVRVAAGTVWMTGALFALAAAVGPDTFVQTLVPAVAMLALAVAPALVVVSPPDAPDATARVAMAGLVLASIVGAFLTLASTSIGPIGMVTLAALLGGIAIAVAPQLAETWGRAAQIVGVFAGAVGVTYAAAEAAVAELGPLAWLGSAWTGNLGTPAARAYAGPQSPDAAGTGWCAVAILVVAGLALAFASRGRERTSPVLDAPLREVGAAGLGLLAIVLAPIAAGASAFVACAVTTGAVSLAMLGSALAVRSRRERAIWTGFLVVIPAIPATGWAALTRATSISVLAVVGASALLAAVVGRIGWLRAAHAGISAAAAIGLASVTMLASGSARPSAALAGLVVAGVVLIAGSLGRRDTAEGLVLEIVGSAGMVGGVLLAVPSTEWVAAGLTAMVPLFLAASVRSDRAALYAGAAGTAALSATWAWLAGAGVTVVEAYTLPAAAIALGAGAFAWKVGRARSWLNLGPAVALALAPTLAVAIARNDDGRAIAVGLAALLILLVGAWQRLQAPIVLGAITLLTLGVDKVGPQAVRMPRWVMLAIAGTVLFWVGMTFERRRDNVQRAARRLVELG